MLHFSSPHLSYLLKNLTHRDHQSHFKMSIIVQKIRNTPSYNLIFIKWLDVQKDAMLLNLQEYEILYQWYCLKCDMWLIS